MKKEIDIERIFKDSAEFVILPYSEGKRWSVVVFTPNGDNKLQFPFNTRDEARQWILKEQFK